MERAVPDLAELNDFIVTAKAETYVGDGERLPSCRSGSHDIGYAAAAGAISIAISAALISPDRNSSGSMTSRSGR